MPSAADIGEPPRLYLGAYGLCADGDGRLLLVRLSADHPDAGCWALPGGGVDWGEHPDVAVSREFEEETGLRDARVVGVRGVYSHTYERSAARPAAPLHHVGIVYDVVVGPGQLRDELGGSTDRCGWVELEETATLPLTPLARFGISLMRDE